MNKQANNCRSQKKQHSLASVYRPPAKMCDITKMISITAGSAFLNNQRNQRGDRWKILISREFILRLRIFFFKNIVRMHDRGQFIFISMA